MVGFTVIRREQNDSFKVLHDINDLFCPRSGSSMPVYGGLTGGRKWFNELGIVGDDDTTTTFRRLLEADAVDIVNDSASTGGADLANRTYTPTQSPPTPAQKWRLLFVAEKGLVNGRNEVKNFTVYWGSPSQIPNVNINFAVVEPPSIKLWSDQPYNYGADVYPNNIPQPYDYVYDYRLTMTRRGFALAMWKNTDPNFMGRSNTLLCIQRPVQAGGANVGKVRWTGRIPLYALDINGAYARQMDDEFRFSIVREEDIDSSTQRKLVNKSRYFNLYGMDMAWRHPNVLSNNSHVIKIPFAFSTDRHVYMEEMDLISFTNAGAFIFDQKAQVSMYNQARQYAGAFGVVEYDTGATEKLIAGARLNLLFSINASDNTDPEYITEVTP